MSIEADFRAALVAYAPLLARVAAGSIAANAVEPGRPMPLIAYSVRVDREWGLDAGLPGATSVQRAQISAQCWAQDAADAAEVADLVEAALLMSGVVVLDRTTVYDEELDANGVALSVEWWDE